MKNILLLVTITLLLFSCKGDVKTTDKTNDIEPASIPQKKYDKVGNSKNGYPYEFHVKNDGRTPVEGDEVMYNEVVFKNDSLVKSSFYTFEPVRAIIPPMSQVANPPPPNFDGVMMMSVGDSLTIKNILSSSSTPLPKWLTKEDTLVYILSMVTLKDKSIISQGIASTKAREKTVGDSLRNYINLYKTGKLEKELTTTTSGLKYLIHDKGDPKFPLKEGNFVQVHYMGCLTDNLVSFNNTFNNPDTGVRPFPFQIGRGRVIAGWDEGIMKLNKGGRMTLFVPYELGYGVAGKPGKDGGPAYIPEKANLAFYVEVIDIR